MATVTKQHISNAVYAARPGLSRRQARIFVEQALEEIVCAVVSGQTVRLHGFGKFEIATKTKRIGRNPRTGEPKDIKARRIVVFRASTVLKVRVANGETGHRLDKGVELDVLA